jgi:hypothetical protein
MTSGLAFRLEPSGPPAACAFPKCVRDAFHDGDHEIAQPRPVAVPNGGRRYRCTICKRAIVEYGEYVSGGADLCDSQECLRAWCIISSNEAPLLCPCRQRPYPHELAIHAQIRSESYNPKLRLRYPWTLCLSPRIEPSTEKSS